MTDMHYATGMRSGTCTLLKPDLVCVAPGPGKAGRKGVSVGGGGV